MLKWRPLSWSGSARNRLSLLLRADNNTVADYRAGIGQTNDGAGLCSAWANQIGAAGSLTAATTARPTIQADGSLLFDGVANGMVTSGFTLNQPTILYLVLKQITWTSGDKITDGHTLDTMLIQQETGGVSPALRLFAGLGTASNSGLTLDTYGVVTALFNGASSSLQINSATAATGDAGSSNAGGFALGANFNTGGSWSNIQVKEVIIRTVADSAATQAAIQGYLKSIYGTP